MPGNEEAREDKVMIVLDTSFLIDYFRGVEVTRDLVDPAEDVAVTVITYHEVLTGLKRKRTKKRRSFSESSFLR